jgi:hypothetical protein
VLETVEIAVGEIVLADGKCSGRQVVAGRRN